MDGSNADVAAFDASSDVASEMAPGTMLAGICSAQGGCWYSDRTTGRNLFAIWGSSSHDVWAVGENGTVFHWDGQAWSGQEGVATTDDLRGIWGSGTDDVWAVGTDTLLHWAGQRWSRVDSPMGSRNYRGIWGAGPNDIWVFSNDGGLSHWNGRQWETRALPRRGAWNSMWGSASNDVWLLGDNLDPLSTASRWFLHWDGATWSEQALDDVGFKASANSIWSASPTDRWAVGFSCLLDHWDGSTWTSVTWKPSALFPYCQERLRSVWGASSTDVWAVGDAGLIVHWDGQAWSGSDRLKEDAWLTTIRGASSSDVWAGGYDGRVVLWDGQAWRQIRRQPFDPRRSSAEAEGIRALAGTSGHDLWAVVWWPSNDMLKSDELIHWDGKAWTNFGSPGGTSISIYALWAFSTSDVWAAATPAFPGTGDLLHWDGKAWTVQAPFPQGHWGSEMWGGAAGDLWVVGNGSALHWNGEAWNSVTELDPTHHPIVVFGQGTSSVWAGTRKGELFNWDGASWSFHSQLTDNSIEALASADGQALWAVATGGQVFYWDGQVWSRSLDLHRPILDLWSDGKKRVWAVGEFPEVMTWPACP